MNDQKINVLLHFYLHEGFKKIFEGLGYRVIWADKKKELEELIQKNKIDIGLEWQQSGNDYTILNLVRKYHPDIPVLLMLNWNGQRPENFENLGYADVISSAPTVQEIREKFNKVI